MNYRPINLNDKFSRFSEFWSPRVIAELNDYQIKLVNVNGGFTWHSHQETDELFMVIDGHMTIEFRDGAVKLSAGEMYVVPKRVEHKPSATETCKILLIEPRGVVNTGESGGALTAPNDVWI